jgi:hypothetical protein
MATLTRDDLLRFDAAIRTRDPDLVMEVLGVDRFNAEFIIALACGERTECPPSAVGKTEEAQIEKGHLTS